MCWACELKTCPQVDDVSGGEDRQLSDLSVLTRKIRGCCGSRVEEHPAKNIRREDQVKLPEEVMSNPRLKDEYELFNKNFRSK